MKKIRTLMSGVLCACVLACGCGKGNSQLDTRPMEKSFASAEPALKTVADAAVTAAKSGDYEAVVRELLRLAEHVKLTPEQQQVVKATLAEAQRMLAAGPPKNVDKLPMSLPK